MRLRVRREKPWMKCGDAARTRQRLCNWYKRRLGRWLQEEEARQLEALLPDLFGYYLLQIGSHYDSAYLNSSRIPFCAILDINHKNRDHHADQQDQSKNLQARIGGTAENMPVATDSLDVMLLQHTLEFSENPHQVLREVDRILIPEGHVILLGFNPWGLWMLWRWAMGWRKRPPWCGKFIRPARLRDWLQLLGFDVLVQRGYFFRPPLSSAKIMDKLNFMERWGPRFWSFFSGAYLIVAKKRVATMTPIKPRWRPRRSRLPAPELAGNSSTITNRENHE